MQRPICVKCGSNFVKLQEELDGYYSHCKCCGMLTLLQSKYEEYLPNDINLAEADPDEKPEKVVKRKHNFTKPSISYYAVKAIKEGNKTSGEIARYVHARLTTSTWVSISGNIGATLTMLNRDHDAVEIVEFKKGERGGSTWALGQGAERYLSLYSIAEEQERIAAVIKAENRKPTLMEMLAGQKLVNPSKRITTLYG